MHDGERPRQVPSHEEEAVAQPQCRCFRCDAAAARRRTMLHHDSRVVEERPTVAREREPEVDLLGGVAEAVVEATGVEEGAPPERDRAAEEVRARARGADT